MANWTNLKAAIAETITTNGNQEITGSILQNTLNTIVNTVGANATFAGVATLATNPGMPDGPVFYLAEISGVYSNFGVTLQDEIAVITNTGNGSWTKNTVLGAATTEKPGMMTAADKKALDDMPAQMLDAINIVDKYLQAYSWRDVLKNKSYAYDSAVVNVEQVDVADPRIGRGVRISNKTAATIQPKFYTYFRYDNNVHISFWAGCQTKGTQGRNIQLVGIQSTQINTNQWAGTDVWELRFSIPPYANSVSSVINGITNNGKYECTIEKVKSYISDFAGNEYESLSVYIDDYTIIDGQYYWHFNINAIGLYGVFSLGLAMKRSEQWREGDSVFIGNIIYSNKPIDKSNDRIFQDGYDAPFKAEKINQFGYDYDLDNAIVDCFDGCGIGMGINQSNFSGWNKLTIVRNHTLKCNYDIVKSRNVIVNPYENKSVEVGAFRIQGGVLPFYVNSSTHNNVFQFSCENVENKTYTAQMWFDTAEWNGNALMRSIGQQFVIIPYTAAKGMRFGLCKSGEGYKYYDKNLYVECIEVIGTLVCLKFYGIKEYGLNLSFISVTGTAIEAFTIYNPTMVEGDRMAIDPYHIYLSHSLKHYPALRGKNLMLLGDSQYNNGIVAYNLMARAGLNIYDGHYGGHSMRYNESSDVNSISKSWFYQLTYRTAIITQENIDYYLMTCSTNDSDGGGELTTEAIARVLDNYPTYSDIGTANETSKMGLFNNLSLTNKKSIFAYAQTYTSYIRQIQENHPYAKVYICTIPISCAGMLKGTAVPNPNKVDQEIGEWKDGKSADTARATLFEKFKNTNAQVKDIAEWTHSHIIDLYQGAGLTFDNYIYHCTDGTHWHNDVSQNCANVILKELQHG